jgi:signal transduction histidine kinase
LESAAQNVPAPATDAGRLGLLRVDSLAPHPRELVLGSIAGTEAILAFAVPLHAHTLLHPGQFAVLVAWSTLSFVLAGLLWWRARPWSRIGPLLCLLGLLIGLTSFQGSENGLAFSLGVVLDAPIALLAWYLIVSFPSGRPTRWGKALISFGAVAVAVSFFPWMFFASSIAGATPLAECGPTCPTNHLMIVSDPGLLRFFGSVEEWVLISFTFLLAATIAIRFVRASRPRRRIVVPVYLATGAWLAAFWVFHVALQTTASSSLLNEFGVGVTLTRSLYPLGFIAAIVLARAYAGHALHSLVRDLSKHSGARSVEESVRRVLDDPSARLAFWLPASGRVVDSDSRAVELPDVDDRVSWQSFSSSNGRPVVAIIHDAVLDEDPELVEAAGIASVMALENRRLDDTLRDSVEELRASQKRLVTAVAAERRRMERDLHDGSQQRLVFIGIQLEQARRKADADSETLDRLGKIATEVDDALEDLRSVAQGIYPALLADWGLQAALKQAASRAGLQVDLDLGPTPRYPDEVEAAIYFCCVEALQNVLKHGGPGARARLRLWTEHGQLSFAVSDNGRGFTPHAGSDGSGLTNMADRLGALGGTYEVTSAPGRGATVVGAVPVASLAQRT